MTGRSDDVAEYQSIRITSAHVIHSQDGREVMRIPVDKIRSLELRKGSTLQHPILAVLVGTLFTLLGSRAFVIVWRWWTQGGTLYDIQVLLVLLIPMGLSLLREAFGRSQYILVQLDSGYRKLPLDGIESNFVLFVENVERISGYHIVDAAR